MRRTRLFPAALATTLLLTGSLAACSGSDEPEATPSAGGTQSKPPADEPAVWPLTGLPAKSADEVVKRHPVYVVKVENNSAAVPQRGLDQADLVVEELVEGNTTRLAAFFYSELPDEVGPIRSMRASDIGIVPAKDAAVVTSGAAAITIKRIREAGVRFLGEGATGIYRASDRPSPHNLMGNLADVATKALKKDFHPDPYLQWGSPDDLPVGKRATSISADFGNQVTTWSFQKGRYVMTNGYAGDQPFPADTVLALRVQVGDAGYKDPAGNFVPETKFEGEGPAFLFHGGKVVRGTWHKDGLTGALTLKARGGDELPVPAGHTFIELVPAENGAVTFGR